MEILVPLKMDLQLAAYALKKRGYPEVRYGSNPIPKRQPVVTTAKRTRVFNEIARRMRHDAWRRQESHDKQLALFMNREKFAQNQTWQGEYDRLMATKAAPGLQPTVDARLEQLKALLVKK